MTMSGTYIEAFLNKLSKPELVQLLLETEATLGSQITDLSKEAYIAAVRTIRTVERVVKTERQCWVNTQYF